MTNTRPGFLRSRAARDLAVLLVSAAVVYGLLLLAGIAPMA